MTRLRSMAAQSPAIIISLIALTFSLGGGAGYAANAATSHHPASVRPAVGKVTWHALKLINGWKNGGFTGYRAPSYAVINGVVYLAGTVQNTHSSPKFIIAVLPKGVRPQFSLEAGAFTSAADFPQDIVISKNGDITLTEQPNTTFSSSLGGISFPVSE